MCVCVCVCVRVCVPACVRACKRACVCRSIWFSLFTLNCTQPFKGYSTLNYKISHDAQPIPKVSQARTDEARDLILLVFVVVAILIVMQFQGVNRLFVGLLALSPLIVSLSDDFGCSENKFPLTIIYHGRRKCIKSRFTPTFVVLP